MNTITTIDTLFPAMTDICNSNNAKVEVVNCNLADGYMLFVHFNFNGVLTVSIYPLILNQGGEEDWCTVQLPLKNFYAIDVKDVVQALRLYASTLDVGKYALTQYEEGVLIDAGLHAAKAIKGGLNYMAENLENMLHEGKDYITKSKLIDVGNEICDKVNEMQSDYAVDCWQDNDGTVVIGVNPYCLDYPEESEKQGWVDIRISVGDNGQYKISNVVSAILKCEKYLDVDAYAQEQYDALAQYDDYEAPLSDCYAAAFAVKRGLLFMAQEFSKIVVQNQ